MQYKYRYHYMFLICILLFSSAYLLDIKPQCNAYFYLVNQQKERKLNTVTSANRVYPYYQKMDLTSQAVLATLNYFLSINHIQLNAIKWLPYSAPDQAFTINLNLSVSPNALATLLNDFSAAYFPIWVTGFTYQADTHILDLDLFIMRYKNSEARNTFITSTSLFPLICTHYSPLIADKTILDNVMLSHLKMIGFVTQGKHRAAWLELPTSQLAAVTVGMQLGKEKARVMQIDNQSIHLALPNHQTMNLTMGERVM